MLGKPTWSYKRHRDFGELFRATGCDKRGHAVDDHVGCDGPNSATRVRPKSVIHIVPRDEIDVQKCNSEPSIVTDPRCQI